MTDRGAAPDPAPGASSNQQALRGSAWMIAMRWGGRLIGLASTLVLARLLTPSDFGVVAMAMVFVAILELASYAGVDLALIRDRQAGREHYDSAWTVQLLQAAAVALLLLASAPFVTSLFDDSRAALVVQVMALNALLDGAQNIGVVAFRKELDFAKEFRFNIYKKLISAALTIAAAFVLRNYWALVIGTIAGTVASLVLSYAMHPYRPRLSLARVSEFWGFSLWLFVARLGSFLNRKLDAVLIGNGHGAAAMGNYHIAQELGTMPANEVVMPMRRALFPTLSAMTADSREFQVAMRENFGMLVLIIAALGAGLYATAPEVVRIALGAQWESAIPLVRWMAIFGVFAGVSSFVEMMLWIENRTHVSAVLNWIEVLALVPVLVFALTHVGIEGVAIGRALVGAAMVAAAFGVVRRMRDAAIGWALVRAASAAGAMAVVLEFLPTGALGWIALQLAVKVTIGALVYVGVLWIIWVVSGRPRGAESALLVWIAAKRRR